MALKDYNKNVFVNCPFDGQYRDLFRAMTFTIIDCGFQVRCAQEIDDASQVRMAKIERLIELSRYGIHDLSRTELDETSKLPRFNMPLELGVFLGAKRFGNAPQRRKSCLIFDTEQYRYQQFISDISGQDVTPHQNDYQKVVTRVRNWLRTQSKRTTIPGGAKILARYEEFRAALPSICASLQFDPEDQLPFNDYVHTVGYWLKDE